MRQWVCLFWSVMYTFQRIRKKYIVFNLIRTHLISFRPVGKIKRFLKGWTEGDNGNGCSGRPLPCHLSSPISWSWSQKREKAAKLQGPGFASFASVGPRDDAPLLFCPLPYCHLPCMCPIHQPCLHPKRLECTVVRRDSKSGTYPGQFVQISKAS